MFQRVVLYLKDRFAALKFRVWACKREYLLLLGAVIIGMITALDVGVEEDETSLNFFAMVTSGNNFPTGYIFAIGGVGAIVFIIAYFTSYHYFVWVAEFPVSTLLSRMIFIIAFKSIKIDGAIGVLFLFVFAIPVLLWYVFHMGKLLSEIYKMCGYINNKLRRLNNSCLLDKIKKLVIKRLLFVLVFAYSIWFVEYIMVIIIVN